METKKRELNKTKNKNGRWEAWYWSTLGKDGSRKENYKNCKRRVG